jgi:hypothetical protein
LLALQRSAGNAAVSRFVQREGLCVQRLFGARRVDTEDLSDWEALRLRREERGRGPMQPGVRGWLRGGMSEQAHEAIEGQLDESDVDEEAPNPLDQHRDLVPTSGQVGVEIAKPTGVLGATAGGYIGGQSVHTASSASSQGISASGGIGGEVLGGVLLADSALTAYSGYSQREHARKRGDRAGVRLGSRKLNAGALAMGAGAIGVAGTGIKLGAALGSRASGLAAGAGALAVAGGAMAMGQGLWRMNAARKHLAALGEFTPATAEGETWKAHLRSQERGRAAANAVKVGAGGLATASGALLASGNGLAGFGVGVAGAALGGLLALGKLGDKISSMWRQRQAKRALEQRGSMDSLLEEQSPEQAQRDPGRHREVHGHADTMRATHSKNAKVAAEIIAAMRAGDIHLVSQARQVRRTLGWTDDATFARVNEYWSKRERSKSQQIGAEDRRLHDAWSLISALNVSPAEAISESGQDLIQQKISIAESI